MKTKLVGVWVSLVGRERLNNWRETRELRDIRASPGYTSRCMRFVTMTADEHRDRGVILSVDLAHDSFWPGTALAASLTIKCPRKATGPITISALTVEPVSS